MWYYEKLSYQLALVIQTFQNEQAARSTRKFANGYDRVHIHTISTARWYFTKPLSSSQLKKLLAICFPRIRRVRFIEIASAGMAGAEGDLIRVDF